jgi:hypothetical protein
MKRFISVALFLVLMAAVGCGSANMEAAYKVTGDATGVTIRATVENGQILKLTGVALPWEKNFTTPKNQTLDLLVTNEGTGSFTAQIYVGGALMRQLSGSGAGGSVSVTYNAD